MNGVELRRFEVPDPTHGAVPCAIALPHGAGAAGLPLCLFLYGGGGSRESLSDIAPLLDAWWSSGLSPMVVATPDVGPWSFYLDDPARGLAWESFVVRFVDHLRGAFDVRAKPALVGISMATAR